MIEKIQTFLIVSGFAGVCGALGYLQQVIEGKTFRWFELGVHSATSAMCGFIVFQLLSGYGITADMAGALCGLSGFMGAKLIKLAEVLLLKKTGVSNAELEEKKHE